MPLNLEQKKELVKEVSGILAEFLALGAMLATNIKYEGTLNIQTASNGPIRLLVADITSSGSVRGYADFDESSLDNNCSWANINRPTAKQLVGKGHLAFTVDQGVDMERYQGIVEIEGDSLASWAKAYFRQSEQIDTDVILQSGIFEGKWRAGGVMLQKMPDLKVDNNIKSNSNNKKNSELKLQNLVSLDEEWSSAQILMSSVKTSELLDSSITPETLTYRLFQSKGVHGLQGRQIKFGCSCSRNRVKMTLKAFPREEISDMLIDGRLTITCQFCNSREVFESEALDDLLSN